jgi:hypothetical protein
VVVESANPYASSSNSKDTGLFEGAPKDRSSRNFRFNPKGKYVALGNQMRQDNQLEALKQRIAESARKAGLDGDMGIERGIKVRGLVVHKARLLKLCFSVSRLRKPSGGINLSCLTSGMPMWSLELATSTSGPLIRLSRSIFNTPFPSLLRETKIRSP